jgi:hypothetical protein
MKIQASEPARPAATPTPAPTPAPSASAKAPVIAADSLVVSSNAAPAEPAPAPTFSWGRAAKNWFQGFVRQPIAVVKGIIEHPYRAAALGVAAGAGILLIPMALPISLTTLGTVLAVGFGSWGALNMALGARAARNDYKDGKYAEAEADFARIGEGSFNLASAAAPYVGRQAIKLLNPGVTTEVAYAERLADGADVIATKAEGLQRAAATATTAGEATRAETLVAAVKELKTYEHALIDQSQALKSGSQSVNGARAAVQKATQTVQASAPSPELSPLRLATSSGETTLFERLKGKASTLFYAIKSDKGIAQRAQAAQKFLGIRRAFKILQPFIGVVPAAPVPGETDG